MIRRISSSRQSAHFGGIYDHRRRGDKGIPPNIKALEILTLFRFIILQLGQHHGRVVKDHHGKARVEDGQTGAHDRKGSRRECVHIPVVVIIIIVFVVVFHFKITNLWNNQNAGQQDHDSKDIVCRFYVPEILQRARCRRGVDWRTLTMRQ